jgi:hypothetical protein
MPAQKPKKPSQSALAALMQHVQQANAQSGMPQQPFGAPNLSGLGALLQPPKPGARPPSQQQVNVFNQAVAQNQQQAAQQAPIDPGNPFHQFYQGVAQQLGIPLTPDTLRFMEAWQRAEGGTPDNPWNTTEGAPGARVINSVGVKRYGDINTGIDATVRTLLNGRYNGIVDALRRGDVQAALDDPGLRTWSGGGYGTIRNMYGG